MACSPCPTEQSSRHKPHLYRIGRLRPGLVLRSSPMSVLDAFSLSGKVSVVTGANRGIGRALVRALAEAGSDVVLLVRDTGGSAEVIAELEALGITAIAVTADVTEPDQVRRAVDEIMDR